MLKMMHSRLFSNIKYFSIRNCLILLLALTGLVTLVQCSDLPENVTEETNVAKIFPEYYNLTIPPNIAPLNFIIKEEGSKFKVDIHGEKGNPIQISQHNSTIEIPERKWHELLSENTGDSISVDIWTFNNKTWYKFKSIQHYVAPEPIDDYLAYRLVYAVYLKWQKMGIYQRNLTNFDETPVIETKSIDYGCINCHTFSDKDPNKMLFHTRILHSGTLIDDDGVLRKIDMKTQGTLSAGIYASWSPSGKYIAFSTGKIVPTLTTRLNKVVDVADKASDLMIYDVEKNKITLPPLLTTKRRENMPVWSADGRYLYFISAPEAKENDLESRLHVRYDLMRVEFHEGKNYWGPIDTVLSAARAKHSISMPSVSPDGKYIVCSMSDYGYFTIFHQESDLYLINTETGDVKKMELNSDKTESHSSWSGNSRWLVFSSKRLDGVLTRPYISYIDKNGIAHNPFVIPQKNPESYDRLLANYNIPELITGKIDLTPIEIRDKLMEESEPVNDK